MSATRRGDPQSDESLMSDMASDSVSDEDVIDSDRWSRLTDEFLCGTDSPLAVRMLSTMKAVDITNEEWFVSFVIDYCLCIPVPEITTFLIKNIYVKS